MSYLMIGGGRPLHGRIAVQCAKNSVLPVLAAALLAGDACRIAACPRLSDVETAVEILRHLGCTAQWDGGDLLVDTTHISRCDIPEELMRKMRSSVIFLGAILSRCGQAELSYPGGCELGPRPIDLHLTALRTLGAEINEIGGSLLCRANRLRGADIVLTLPSVGATENAILAACGAEGTTVIANAAGERQPTRLHPPLHWRPDRGIYIPVRGGRRRRSGNAERHRLPASGHRHHGAASGRLPPAM